MASPLRPLHVFSERYNLMLVRLGPEGELTNGIKNHTPLLRTKYLLQINVNKSDENSPIGVITFQAEKQEPLDEETPIIPANPTTIGYFLTGRAPTLGIIRMQKTTTATGL